LKPKKKAQVAVFCSGNGSNLEALLQAEKKHRIGPSQIALVVCDKPGARAIVRANLHRKPVCLLEAAYFKSREDYDLALVRVLRAARIDLCVLAGFMRILTPHFTRAFEGRVLNIHPSLLPSFKGAHAIRDAFEYGVKTTGVSVHFVTEDLDAGPIVLQEPVEVAAKDSLSALEVKIHKVEHRLYARAVRLFAEGRLKVRGRVVQIT